MFRLIHANGTLKESHGRIVTGLRVFATVSLAFGVFVFLADRFLAITGFELLVGSFGAATATLFLAPESPAVRPRSVLIAHLVGSSVGVCCRLALVPQFEGLAALVAVALTISILTAFDARHPPGGALALIAVIGPDDLLREPVIFILTTGVLGPLLLLSIVTTVRRLTNAP
ncbi:MAG: HPP family protein [Geminicoccaceae bacterium]